MMVCDQRLDCAMCVNACLSAWHQLQAKSAAAIDVQLLFDLLTHSISSHIPFPHILNLLTVSVFST